MVNRGLHCYGDTFISFLLEMAGGDNIAKNEQGWSYSKEALIEKI